MNRNDRGPRRAKSLETYLRQTRVLAAIAVAALAAGIISDVSASSFWVQHALLAGLAASVIVVMLSVAVVNEVIDRRQRQRWSVLAQYVMFELVRNARMIWTGILDAAGALREANDQPRALELGTELVRDTPRLAAAIRDALEDSDRRALLHSEIAFLEDHADEVLSRWAAVMLGTELYAEIIDRHVELAGDIGWIGGLFEDSQPSGDLRRQKRAFSNPATQIQPELDEEWLAGRIVVIVQLAEQLDSGTLDLALQIVPVEWWQERLSTGASDDRVEGRA